MLNGQGSHSLDLASGARDELGRFASCEAAETAVLFVFGRPDFPNGSGQIENQVAARRKRRRVASTRVRYSGANLGNSISDRQPEMKLVLAVRT